MALLNSSVSNFYLKNTAIERQGGFIEQKPMYVKEIPIPTVSKSIKELLAQKVDSLLQLHKEKDERTRQALEVLKTEYAIRKVTHKLENFLRLGWNEFIEELEKQHTLFTLQKKDELNKWFREKQKGFQALELDIKKVDEFIDMVAFKLYNLSTNERQIMLRSIQQSPAQNGFLQAVA